MFATLAAIFMVRAAVQNFKLAREIVAEGGKRYANDEEITCRAIGIALVFGTAVSGVVGLVNLFGDGWIKLFAPLGWLVTKTLT